jgi:CelD/BcsL family acetyltransferase involved in cellulose biosynthesis
MFVKVTVVQPADLGDSEIARWRDLQAADPRLVNPFLTPEFAVVYGRHNPSARVAVIEDAAVVTGFFPFEKSGLGVGRSLAYRFADCQGLVCSNEAALPAHELMARCRLAVFEFDHLLEHQAASFARRPILRSSPVIDLSAGWEHWLADKKKSGSRIKRALEKRRKLEREIGPLSFVEDSRDHGDLRSLIDWKTQQYARTGRSDFFGKTWRRDFMHDLLDTREGNFSVRLARLSAGDHTIALYLCTRSGPVLGSWFPSYDPEFSRYSPGLISVLSTAEAAAADGITKIDLGKGREDYKSSLKNYDDVVARGVAERPGAATIWYRVHEVPRRAAYDLVERSPRAFRLADATMRRTARMRAWASRQGSRGPWAASRGLTPRERTPA